METNGSSHRTPGPGKRKHSTSPSMSHDRPHKIYHKEPSFYDLEENDDIHVAGRLGGVRPVTGRAASGGVDTDRDMDRDMDSEEEEMMLTGLQLGCSDIPRVPAGAATTDTAEWQRTIENVVRNVVSIRFCQTCSFDTDDAVTSEATGFVVDAEKGYILTNRHVVGAGPFWGYCVFDNHEEVSWLSYAISGRMLIGGCERI